MIGNDTVGGDPDVLAFDPSSKRLYVTAESGEVAVAVDPATHLVYLQLESGSAGRPSRALWTVYSEPPPVE